MFKALWESVKQTGRNCRDPHHPGPEGRRKVRRTCAYWLLLIVAVYCCIVWSSTRSQLEVATVAPGVAITKIADMAEVTLFGCLAFCAYSLVATRYLSLRVVIACFACVLVIFANRIVMSLGIITNHLVSDPQGKDVAVYLGAGQNETNGIAFGLAVGLLVGLLLSDWKSGPKLSADLKRFWNGEPSEASLERWK